MKPRIARLDNFPYCIKNYELNFICQTGVFATVMLDPNADSVV